MKRRLFSKKGPKEKLVKVLPNGDKKFVGWKKMPLTLERAKNFVMYLGPYKGRTLEYIRKNNLEYLKMLAISFADDNIGKLAKLLLEGNS